MLCCAAPELHSSWCQFAAAVAQQSTAARSPPAAQVGTCNALRGLCTCPAGWRGFNCLHPMPRICTHKHRMWGFEVPRVPADLAIGIKDDDRKPWQFTRSHCAGEANAQGGVAARAGQAKGVRGEDVGAC